MSTQRTLLEHQCSGTFLIVYFRIEGTYTIIYLESILSWYVFIASIFRSSY